MNLVNKIKRARSLDVAHGVAVAKKSAKSAGAARGYNPYRDAHGRFAPGPRKGDTKESRYRKITEHEPTWSKTTKSNLARPAASAFTKARRAAAEKAAKMQRPVETPPMQATKMSKSVEKQPVKPTAKPMAEAFTAARRKLSQKAMETSKAIREEIDRRIAVRRHRGEKIDAAQEDKARKQEYKQIKDRYKVYKGRKEEIPHLLPPLGMSKRLEMYSAAEGDRKLKAILAHEPKTSEWTDADEKRLDTIKGRLSKTDYSALPLAEQKEYHSLLDRKVASTAGTEKARDAIFKTLEISEGAASGMKLKATPDRGLVNPSDQLAKRVNKALSTIGRMLFKGDLDKTDVPTGMLDPARVSEHGNRSWAGAIRIHLTPYANQETVWHEFGHYLEGRTGAGAAARAFLVHRTGDEPLRPINDFAKEAGMESGYHPGEKGRSDKFGQFFTNPTEAAYVGKHYDSGVTEITSMGLQALYRDPIRFAKKDPEYCKFILGILSGHLR